jgi:phosphoenolpyruvate carboxylase
MIPISPRFKSMYAFEGTPTFNKEVSQNLIKLAKRQASNYPVGHSDMLIFSVPSTRNTENERRIVVSDLEGDASYSAWKQTEAKHSGPELVPHIEALAPSKTYKASTLMERMAAGNLNAFDPEMPVRTKAFLLRAAIGKWLREHGLGNG